MENDTIEPAPGELFWVKTLGFERPPEVVATKRDKILERDMTIALPLSETGVPQGNVYAYLPVLTDSGLPFLVNADFLLTSSREGIKEDEPWNHWLCDCIAPCFVAAFRELLLHREFRYQAYRFLPLRSDRARSEFFQGVTAAIHAALKDTAVIVREHREELVTPEEANRADESFRELFSTPEPPSSFCQQRLVSAKIECFGPQLTELGVMSVTASDVLECLQNRQWLSKRPLEWFIHCYDYLRTLAIDENLAQRLRECSIVPIEGRGLSWDSEQPIYLSASKEDRTFLQTVPTIIRAPVAFLRPVFRSFVEERGGLTVWMQDVLGVYSFSRPNYCIDIVNRLTRDYTSVDVLAIIAGTRFLARFCDDLESITEMPIVLRDGSRSLLSTLKSLPTVAHVVTPEAMDPDVGWQHVFETEQDKSHLAVLSNRYIEDKTVAVERDALCRFFIRRLGITATPLPRQHLVSKSRTSEQSEYERQCFADIYDEWSTREKTVENRLSPSWLSRLVQGQAPEDLERKTRALAAWLRRQANPTARIREAWTEAHIKYFFRRENWKTRESEFLRDLKATAWLPTTAGPTIPKNVFVKDPNIDTVLGQTVPYMAEEIPPWAIDLLGVRKTVTPKDLLGVLQTQAEAGARNGGLASKVYGFLAQSGGGSALRREFSEKPLIHLPDHPHRWFRSGEVVWSERSETFGDAFAYLEPVYPHLREFFVENLGIKRDVDAESFANRWLALSMAPPADPGAIERPMTQIFQALLPDCQRVRSGATEPVWWGKFAGDVRFWCQDKSFKRPNEAYVADDGEMRRLFAKEDVAFVWRPEKASYADFEDLYRTLGAHFLSESVHIECLDTSPGAQSAQPQFLTAAAKAQILAWAENTLNKEQGERLNHGGILSALAGTQEERVKNLRMRFSLGSLSVVGDRMAYWDLKRKKLFVEDVSDEAEAVRQEVAETIARGLMQNRPYRDVESFVFQVLCSNVTRARSFISKRGWSLSEEAKALLDTVGIDNDDRGTAAQLRADQKEPEDTDTPPETGHDLNYRSELEGVLNRPGHTPPQSDGWIGGTGLVSRPAQRRERTAVEITRDLAREPSRDERVFDVLRQEWECPDPVIRQQLLEEYQGHCQICQDGFRKRTGEPFFISKYLVSRTKARTIDRLGNVLCLCATCAAKFQHGAVEMQPTFRIGPLILRNI